MAARIFVALGLVLVIVGTVFAWPLIYASLHYQVVRGRVLDVFTEPLPDGMVRLSVVYDFPIPVKRGKVIAMGCNQADRGLHPIADPVVRANQAAEYERILMREAPFRRVFFDVNDPEGTAFMVTGLGGGRGVDPNRGIALILGGLLLWCTGFAVRARR